jgi:hypothetical protein
MMRVNQGYQKALFEECTKVFSRIDDARKYRELDVDNTVLVDTPEVCIAEQALHTMPTPDGVSLAFSVPDVSLISLDGLLAGCAQYRERTKRTREGMERMFPDMQVNDAFSFRANHHEDVATQTVPAITFVLGPEGAGGLVVRSVKPTVVPKTPIVIRMSSHARLQQTDLALVADWFPDRVYPSTIAALATDAVNVWAQSRLTGTKAATLDHCTIHRPLRRYEDYRNLVQIAQIVQQNPVLPLE